MAYFIRIRGKAFGPFDEEQLTEMKSQGKLGKTTEVSENKNDWQPAESLSFLYPPPPQASSGSSTSSGSIYGTKAPQEPANWFYSINGNEGFGPLTATTIEQMLRSGQLNGDSYVWEQGQNARFIKNEPRFTTPASGTTNLATAEKTGNMATIGGEITGTSEQVDTGKMLRPVAASLGWLMFLKITFLIGLIVQGLGFLSSLFWIAHYLGAEQARLLMAALIVLALNVGLYLLQFKTFLCFWKYHNDLYLVVATGRASDLIRANQCQHLFWKWLGITVISYLSVILVVATVIAVLMGFESGSFINRLQNIFPFPP